ncbi:MAG TPA: type III-A CRISPR-associated protein Cas10/Csm1 [Oscillatoriaceae cyanobacterium M33_DOE_052]|uniref:CRISPR system single-strand-specific deoxyribonuclease Cas10/Csm1 (subtype III-A) n=1 Tax=Planktothricoides sp. SpSt-374 TaxID=2282167 RepID=A0A7C3VK69_9CYAN|nr:type III-A CRISPR-associated protein Cas10/Csm1 [Oscillatoriaceae cyanobacterium M33_DOE_052]
MTKPSATDVALQITQQAIAVLAEWAGVTLPPECIGSGEDAVVRRVKQMLGWPDGGQPQPLRLLFDGVNLGRGQTEKHYWQAKAIADEDPQIYYPQTEPPNLEPLRVEVKTALGSISGGDWQNLSVLTLILEKFGSYLSFGEADIALVDLAKSAGAVATALASHPDSDRLSLIAGDLSGIQKFIYTITADGALKSLRARSFFLELVLEEVVQQLLEALNLLRPNVIYAGGGNLYIVASGDREKVTDTVQQVRTRFNDWLLDNYQGKIFLALDVLDFPVAAVGTGSFGAYWSDATKKLAEQKSRKFENHINKLLAVKTSYTPCRVCHRDDSPNLKPLNQYEPDSPIACGNCRQMFELGGQLLRVEAILRSRQKDLPKQPKGTIEIKLGSDSIYYHLFNDSQQIPDVSEAETVFLVNDWQIDKYRPNYHTMPLLLGNYGKESEVEPGQFMRAGEMAATAIGIERLGYLRMDADQLGRIFAEGLGDKKTLPRVAGLSRQMSYFFKVYLNSLAKWRNKNCPAKMQRLTEDTRPTLMFIYAGGDDLFVSGAWNEVIEFAFDVYQCFRAYTGNNPDITLSGGVSIEDVKFPLYQAAESSKQAEKAAKGNGRDSFGLFGEKFKWEEWLGIKDATIIDEDVRAYLSVEKSQPELWGVLPLVQALWDSKLELNYARSFVRNLLLTAELQKQMLKKVQEKQVDMDWRAIRYYLHLPKIAYTLARLPSQIRDRDDFAPVRTSLKSPYNAPYFRAIATWLELLNRT